MAQSHQTPGVYINAQSTFPNSVVEVATAIPAFIGYTERAMYQDGPLQGIPTRIASLQEFENRFGGAFRPVFDVVVLAAGKTAGGPLAPGNPGHIEPTAPATLTGGEGNAGGGTAEPVAPTPGGHPPTAAPNPLPGVPVAFDSGTRAMLTPRGASLFYLYNSLRLFYLNGGGRCYIVSAGSYDDGPRAAAHDFITALDALQAAPEPTMLVCPDALLLPAAGYATVMQAMLNHCGELRSRVALFDVYGGTTPGTPPTPGADIAAFRSAVTQHLDYGVAYFPWLHTSLVSAEDLSFDNLSAAALATLRTLLPPSPAGQSAALLFQEAASFVAGPVAAAAAGPDAQQAAAQPPAAKQALHHKLKASSPEYGQVLQAMAAYVNVLPAAPAMAGVYTTVDTNRGVWKAPANCSLSAVVSPTMNLSDHDQAHLNVDAVTGKSINAIRSFRGMGTMVWGARTLDGNSQDWRFINVRRTVIMIEQSIKLALRAYVFEPNDANTWAQVHSLLSNFLFNLWKQGALFGSNPADAYQVQVGLGSTMTGDDILNGYMNVSVLVALVRPAEFIMVTFQQPMQKS